MMFLNSMKWCCVAITLSLLMASSTWATEIYCEIFATDGTGWNKDLSTSDWSMHYGDGAVANADLISGAATLGTPVEPVNSNPVPNYDTSKGYVINLQTAVADYFLWTEEYTVDRSQWDITEVSWTQKNVALPGSDIFDNIQVALEISGQWYITDTTFPNIVNDAIEYKSYDMSGTWSTLDFTAGSALAIGSQSGLALPSGNVTGFGLYCDERNGVKLRLDTFAINAVEASEIPEPSMLVLLTASLLGLAGIAWRKKR